VSEPVRFNDCGQHCREARPGKFFRPKRPGVYRAIGIEAGMQFPLYRDIGPLFPKERYRFTVNFAYFF